MGESCAFLLGDKEIRFCGCKGVGKYSESEIVLMMNDMCVSICGSKLTLSTFRNGEISVAGTIENINLIKNGGGRR
jgi:sporulation protein YqfC